MASGSSDDWQSSKNSVLERNRHTFDNSFMSDITLTCGASSRVFHAHKYVLATSSQIFYELFLSDPTEKTSNLHLPDTDEESLLEFLRFLYTDDNEMTWNIALKVMYLSKKYNIPCMTKKCCEVLEKQVCSNNVFAILDHAVRHNEVKLQGKCWEALDWETTDALNSEAFAEISVDTLNILLKREGLTCEEIDLCQAVFMWSEKQCLKRNLDVTGENRRKILGDAVFNLRFTVMSKEEFTEHVSSSGLLTADECAGILQVLDEADVPNLPWMDHEPRLRAGLLSFTRFGPGCVDLNKLEWGYQDEEPDQLAFTVNEPFLFHGARLFGNPSGSYYTYMYVSCEETDQVDETEGTYVAVEDKNSIGGYDILFDEPLTIFEANKKIVISAKITGPSSNHGENGVLTVQRNETTVTFSNSESRLYHGNGTDRTRGQFHKIYLSPA